MSLNSALSTALQQVSTLQQAQIDQQIAAEQVRQSEAALLPQVRDAYSVTYNTPEHRGSDVQAFIAENAVHEYQNLLGVTGSLDYSLFAAVRRSRALLEAARAGTEVARRALVRAVNEAYYGAALATAKRASAEQSLAAAEEFQRNTELNYKAGEVPKVDVIRARLETAARRDDLAQAQQAEVIANATLGALLGYPISQIPNIEPLPLTVDVHDIESISAADVARNPEFVQLEAQVRAAQADVGVSRAGLLPNITYEVDEGFDTPSLTSSELRKHKGILAMATINVPIFDWGATWAKIRQAELRTKGAELQRQLAIRDLYLQFATARQQALTAAERVANARAAVADAQRNVDISIARYRAGEGTIVEATDALTTLATQRFALEQALYDYQVARARLLEAVGQ